MPSIRELSEGAEVDCVLLVHAVETRQRRDGGEFLRVTFADRSGRLNAMVWEPDARSRVLLEPGRALQVRGRYQVHQRYGPQLQLSELREPDPDDVALDELLDGPARTAAQMETDLRELLGTVQNPRLKELLERVFGEDSELWASYREAPAAKYYHQAYRHGLLEHSLGVAQAVSAISSTFPGIDRDVAVTGALLHDIGKLEAYSSDPRCIDLTDAGRLQGEIALGYYRIRREIERIEDFPAELAQAVLHIILAHHGSLEHGSPVLPCTREATLVHMIDNLGGRLGSFDRLEKELPDGQRWSAYDRALGALAYFAKAGEGVGLAEAA